MRRWNKEKAEGSAEPITTEAPSIEVSDIVETIAAESTEPTVAAATEPIPALVAEPSLDLGKGDRDAAGDTFDRTRHSVGSDGKPVRTAKGLWRRRRGVGSLRVASTAVQTADENEKFILAGKTCAECLFQGAGLLGGPEWQPKVDATQDERRDMAAAFTTYCRAKNLSDIPPGIILLAIITSYAAPRFAQPITQKRTAGAIIWMREKYRKWRMGRAAQSDNRNDGKRENDASKKDSGGASEAGK